MNKKHYENPEEESRKKAADRLFRHSKKYISDIVPDSREHTIKITAEDRAFERDEKREPVERRIHPQTEHDDDSYEDYSVKYSRHGHFRGVRFPRRWKMLLAIVLALVVVGGAAQYILPTADVHLTLEKTSWTDDRALSAQVVNGNIPAQVFSDTENLQVTYAATGKEGSPQKAHGIITIYNNYSTSPQTLIATTRFLTPDGILFRLDSVVTVPAAKKVDGKLVPQGIDAKVTADKAGTDGNIGPVTKWSIPGFKGSPRYEGFYGVSENSMSGGSLGDTPYPTKEDIAAAKQEAEQKIQDALLARFQLKVPNGFTILDAGDALRVTKSFVMDGVDEGGNFKYFIEAKQSRLGIKEDDLVTLLTKLAMASSTALADMELHDHSLKYTVTDTLRDNADALSGAKLNVHFTGNFVNKIDTASIKGKLAGKSQSELQQIIPSLSGIAQAQVTLWPFWVFHVPSRVSKITVTTD